MESGNQRRWEGWQEIPSWVRAWKRGRGAMFNIQYIPVRKFVETSQATHHHIAQKHDSTNDGPHTMMGLEELGTEWYCVHYNTVVQDAPHLLMEILLS